MERRNITDSPMEIYIHIPFCIKKCDYCDFLSGPSGPKEQADYVDALLEEINAADIILQQKKEKEGVYPLYLLEGALLLFWMRDS